MDWCWSWNSSTSATSCKNQLFGKDTDAGKDWGEEEKGVTEDKMAGWYHKLSGHEFEQTRGNGEGQGSLASCSLWGRKELDVPEQLNNSNKDGRREMRES